MVTGTVPVLSIVSMAISAFAGFAIPVALFLYFRKKGRADILPFFVGCGVMLVFALILESMVHQVVLGSAVGGTIRNSVWLYAVYGGLMAGLFEETGRFVAFRTVLVRKRDKDVNALMYGAGHGGLEAAVLLGVAMIGNIALAMSINDGSIAVMTSSLPTEALTQLQAVLETLTTTPPSTYVIAIMERVLAVTLQMSLSVMVWFAAKDERRWYLYPVAILIHLLVDALAVALVQYGVPILAVEGVIGVATALVVVLAKRTWDAKVNG